MEIFLAIGVFAASFLLLSLGVLFTKKEMRAGSCGSKVIIKGEPLSCGACASKEAEVCPSGDKEGFATLAQLGTPNRKRKLNRLPFSQN
jgi:hypothetical protein